MHDFATPETWLAHRVSYGETDAMKVVYYAEYLREAQCRYRRPAHYDELIWIRTGISEWGRASLRFLYEIWDEDKTHLLVTGMTQQACVNAQGKPVAAATLLHLMKEAPPRQDRQ